VHRAHGQRAGDILQVVRHAHRRGPLARRAGGPEALREVRLPVAEHAHQAPVQVLVAHRGGDAGLAVDRG